jgi:helicase
MSKKKGERDSSIITEGLERVEKIQCSHDDPSVDIVLDTLKKGKQALVFVNTKPRAEKSAEELSKVVVLREDEKEYFSALSKSVLDALDKPTTQCERLARCVKSGIAFHHAGLAQKQRELIEDSFREGRIKVICCTPTLAYGLDLPAFRVIVKDLKRFGSRGIDWIPTLEIQQMFGRAGRPSYDKEGEAICIAKEIIEGKEISRRFISGEPEEIYSKLAVEPVLRTYILSLISSGFVDSRDSILAFFKKTFWAHQFQSTESLYATIDKMLALLREWEFIILPKGELSDDFVSADEIKNNSGADLTIFATPVGKRVAELYLDPMTAHHIIECLNASRKKLHSDFSFLQMVCHTLEMYPLLNVKTKEYEDVETFLLEKNSLLLEDEPESYALDYDEFLNSIKTAMLFCDWMDEKDEDFLLEKYNVRPGELSVKKGISDWLLYSAEELSMLLSMRELKPELERIRIRINYGAKEELLPLLRLKGIGKIRARLLFSNKIKDLGDVKKADLAILSQLIGKALAVDVKSQLGENVSEEDVKVKENKRKGQINLGDFSK